MPLHGNLSHEKDTENEYKITQKYNSQFWFLADISPTAPQIRKLYHACYSVYAVREQSCSLEGTATLPTT